MGDAVEKSANVADLRDFAVDQVGKGVLHGRWRFRGSYPAGEVRKEITAVTALEWAEVTVASGVVYGWAALLGERLRWGW